MQIQNLCGKARHTSNQDALRELVYLLNQGAKLDTLRIYECAFCTSPVEVVWHVGNSIGRHDPEPPPKHPLRRGIRRRLRMLG